MFCYTFVYPWRRRAAMGRENINVQPTEESVAYAQSLEDVSDIEILSEIHGDESPPHLRLKLDFFPEDDRLLPTFRRMHAEAPSAGVQLI